jgi:hypothetical protein
VGRSAIALNLNGAFDVGGCQCRGPVTGPDGRETPSDLVVASVTPRGYPRPGPEVREDP